MRQLDDDIWTESGRLRFFGVPVRVRMTVVRLADGPLWVHSPIAIEPERRRRVEQLGEVGYIVAPNRYHHVHAGDWADAYPEAELWGAPGLPEKRDDLEFDHVLTQSHAPWADQIDTLKIEGIDELQEVVFYHRPSRTVVAADLFFNESRPNSFLQKAYLWVNGILGRAGISKLVKFVIDDPGALRESFERILEWDFERIVISHGQIVEEEAHATLRQVIDADLS